MVELTYTADSSKKSGLLPSSRAIKRVALALAAALGIAGAGEFGYGYLTNGRYLKSTDDAYVKANSTLVSPRSPDISRKFWSATMRRSRPGRSWRGSTTAILPPR